VWPVREQLLAARGAALRDDRCEKREEKAFIPSDCALFAEDEKIQERKREDIGKACSSENW
jgi:hypothetical protein